MRDGLSAVESSKREDQARRVIPVPICLESLERHGDEGVVSAMTPDDYWRMVLPSYDAASHTVDLSSADRAGRETLAGAEFMGAEGARSGTAQVSAKDAVITPAPDKFKVVGGQFTQEPYGIGLAKGKTEFTPFVNAVLANVKQSGRWQEIHKQWLGRLVPNTPQPPTRTAQEAAQ